LIRFAALAVLIAFPVELLCAADWVSTESPAAATDFFGFREWYELDAEQQLRANAVAAVAYSGELLCLRGACLVQQRPLATACASRSGGRVYDQPTIEHATAFLVGPRTIMTSGHALSTRGMCAPGASARLLRIIFDFRMDTEDSVHPLDLHDIYEGSTVTSCSSAPENDVAVVELSVAVVNRTPLRISVQKQAPQPITSLGHPLGLPVKFATGTLSDLSASPWRATLNASRGSSGAPVFDSSGDVIGLIRSIRVPARLGAAPCDVLEYCAATTCVTSIVPVHPIESRLAF
jgi:hypothetical protein